MKPLQKSPGEKRNIMTSKLAKGVANAKSHASSAVNQNCLDGNRLPQISPVMQKVKASLGRPNGAETLAFLTKGSLSTCQKLLSGHLTENGEMVRAMCRTYLTVDVILGLTEGATDPTARRVHKLIKRLKHEIEIEKIDAGRDDE
jgi:hypothetical protein